MLLVGHQDQLILAQHQHVSIPDERREGKSQDWYEDGVSLQQHRVSCSLDDGVNHTEVFQHYYLQYVPLMLRYQWQYGVC